MDKYDEFEEEVRRKDKKQVIIILVLAILPILINVLAFAVNDISAALTAKEIAFKPLPPSTRLLEVKSQAAKLVGNGNGMQYFGVILIESELSLDELKEYYNDFTVKEQKTQQISFDHRDIVFKTDVSGRNCYAVSS